jgi:hypothetical protein
MVRVISIEENMAERRKDQTRAEQQIGKQQGNEGMFKS